MSVFKKKKYSKYRLSIELKEVKTDLMISLKSKYLAPILGSYY